MPKEDRSVLERPARPPDQSWSYGSLPEQVADVYAPHGATPPRGVVVLVHGGFWRPEYDRIHLRPLAEALADDGYLTVSLEYRRVPGRPEDTVGDVRAALRRLPALLTEHDATKASLVLAGHSAGGHLALLLASEPGVGAPCLALAPVADLRAAERLRLGGDAVSAFLGVPADGRPALDPAARDAPAGPVTVVHGADDEIVPASVARSYAAAHRGSVRLVVVPDCGHFAVIDPLSAVWSLVQAELARLVLNEPRDH